MNTVANTPVVNTPNHFSHLLRHWRRIRRLSQMELALRGNVSARHVSFLESGRSNPSRQMVQLLCSVLDLSLEERNNLHVAAGFVPPYRDERPVIDRAPHVRRALDFILKQQEPYPAIVINGHWDVQMRNDSMMRLFEPFRDAYAMEEPICNNAMHSVFHPKGLRPFIVNWEEFAGEMLHSLYREISSGSRVSAQLLDEIMVYPDVCSLSCAGGPTVSSPVMSMHLAKGDYRVKFFSTFTTFAMPADAALQQLKIECFYPADDETAHRARATVQQAA
jgi:transcriptional regulator with XRE-family HTH domain